jgi:hypothetical protein
MTIASSVASAVVALLKVACKGFAYRPNPLTRESSNVRPEAPGSPELNDRMAELIVGTG